MSVDWSSVETQIVKAVQDEIGPAFNTALSGTKAQVAQLIVAGSIVVKLRKR